MNVTVKNDMVHIESIMWTIHLTKLEATELYQGLQETLKTAESWMSK